MYECQRASCKPFVHIWLKESIYKSIQKALCSSKWLASGIELWEFYFQIQACCALTSAFKKITGKHFFLQSNAFFCRQRFLSKKIALNGYLSSCVSLGDGGQK
jgi:hypothetical protein